MGHKIPQWAIAIGGTLICSLVVVSVGLGTYIFTDLAETVDELSNEFKTMNQKVWVIEAKLDTAATQCRFPHKQEK